MNELALFSGAGGGILGSVLLGHRVVCAVEIDPYCREILLRRQEEKILPPFPIWDDVRTFDGRPWRGVVDLVSAGFPCQPFSSAARGRNNAANLFCEVERIIAEVQPRYILLENVLARAYPPGCRLALQRICATELGAAHPRARFWLAAYADGDGERTVPVDAEVAVTQAAGDFDPWQGGPGGVLGMDDGLAARVDRLKALGNGQVPRVVVEAWRRLTALRKEGA